MPQLWEGVLSTGLPGEPARIQIGHWLDALLAEYATEAIPAATAISRFETMAGMAQGAASATMRAELQDVVDLVLVAIPLPALPAITVTRPVDPPSGANAGQLRTWAVAHALWHDQNNARRAAEAARALAVGQRAHRIRDVQQKLMLAVHRVPGYDTPAELRASLGVTTRP